MTRRSSPRRRLSQDSDMGSIDLFQSSPEPSRAESDGSSAAPRPEDEPSPATKTLNMLGSQLLSQEDLMYDHSQTDVDAERVRKEQLEWIAMQRKGQESSHLSSPPRETADKATPPVPQGPTANSSGSSIETPSKDRIESTATKSNELVDSDEETVDPEEPAVAGARGSNPLLAESGVKDSASASGKTKDVGSGKVDRGSSVSRSKSVAQIDPTTYNIIKVFPSLSQAAAELEEDVSRRPSYRSTIGRAVTGEHKHCRKGFVWRLADDTSSSRPVIQVVPTPRLDKRAQTGKRVAHIDSATGAVMNVYPSFLDAAKAFESNHAKHNSYAVSIGRAATGFKEYCRKGLIWKLVDENGTVSVPSNSVSVPSNSTPPSGANHPMKTPEAAQIKFLKPNDNTSRNRRVLQVDSLGRVLQSFPSFLAAASAVEPDSNKRNNYRKEISKVVAGVKSQCRHGFVWRSEVAASKPSSATNRASSSSSSSSAKRTIKQVSFCKSKKARLEDSKTDSSKDGVPATVAVNRGFHVVTPNAESIRNISQTSKTDNFCIKRVSVMLEGPLGLHVTQMACPKELKLAIRATQDACCVVDRINPAGIGFASGFRDGDVLIRKSNERVSLWEYNAFLDMIRGAARPVNVFVVRRLNNVDMESAEALLALQNPSLQSPTVLPSQSNQTPICGGQEDLHGAAPIRALDLYSGVVPFCKLCNGGNFREHHTLCPEHPRFHHNNSEKILERIRRGVELRCNACIEEYKTGKLVDDGSHNARCQRAQIYLKKTMKDMREIQTAAKSLNEVETNASGADGQAPVKGKKNAAPKVPRQMKVGTSERAEESRQSLAPLAANVSRKAHPSPSPSRTKQISAQYYQTYWELSVPSDMEVARVDWVQCEKEENPWGSEGYQDGDTVVWSHKTGIGSFETVGPCERFASNPFDDYPSYKSTHTTPSEGLHVLVLRRDLPGKMPWGFDWKRHNFGGACLVTRVEPYSPASFPTLLGDSSPQITHRLRVNDMVLAINESRIGGMTAEGFGLALEVSGPEIQLVVSRYKDASVSETIIQQTEDQMFAGVNKAMIDKLNLDWIDVIGTVRDFPPDRVDISPPPDSSRFTASETDGRERLPHSDQGKARGSELAIDGANQEASRVNEKIVAQSPSMPQRPAKTFRPVAQTPGTGSPNSDISVSGSIAGCGPIPERNKMDNLGSEDSMKDDDADNGSLYVSTGCICGVTHLRLPVFWIRCDGCDAWFCNAEKCTGMTKDEAQELDKWLCPACDECPATDSKDTLQSHPTDKVKGRETPEDDLSYASSAEGKARKQKATTVSSGDADDKSADADADSRSSADNAMIPQKGFRVFEKDDVVYIKEHAWVGVDNPAGIAKILDSRIDGDGNRVYDIRYVVGGTRKGVEAEYVTHHNWDHPAGW